VKTTKIIYYTLPLFLLSLMVISILLNTNLFVNEDYTFVVWFVLMLAAFAAGKLMFPAFSKNYGAKIILVVTVIAAFLDLGIVATFHEKFSVHATLIGNLVLFALRVMLLGFSAFFGFIYSQLSRVSDTVKKEEVNFSEDNKNKEQVDLIIKQAKLKAEKIIFDAQKEAGQIKENKEKLELELRQLIQTEREVLRQYENDENNNNEIDSE